MPGYYQNYKIDKLIEIISIFSKLQTNAGFIKRRWRSFGKTASREIIYAYNFPLQRRHRRANFEKDLSNA